MDVGLSGYYAATLFLTLAIAPAAYLLWFFYHKDRYKHESTKLLTVTFLIAIVLMIPVIFIEQFLTEVIPPGPDVLSIFLSFLIGVGLVEEGDKFLAVRLYAFRSVHFDEPMDGIVFGATAGIGFAVVENILYVFSAASGDIFSGLVTAAFRAVAAVPGHAMWGAITGFYLAKGKVSKKPLLTVVGLAISTFLHGFYDTVATVIPDNATYGILGLAFLITFVFLVYFKIVKRDIIKAEEESPYRASVGAHFSPTPSHPRRLDKKVTARVWAIGLLSRMLTLSSL